MEKIDNNNYELWLLRYAEGELSATERSEVEAWLESHPEAAEELVLYNEAPRLERDDTVTYAAAPTQPTSHSLWPAMCRWSAAAAVLIALMLPALRMGTMDTLEPQPLLATAPISSAPPNIQKTQNTPTSPTLHPTPAPSENTIAAIETFETIETIGTIDTIATTDTIPTLETIAPPQFIYTNSLIVYEPPQDTIVTNTLIVYDDSRPKFRDKARKWVEDSPIAKILPLRKKSYALQVINLASAEK